METMHNKNIQTKLEIYYKRLFPSKILQQWLTYGNDNLFSQREFSFTYVNEARTRYKSFTLFAQLQREIQRVVPLSIDIGPIYNISPLYREPSALIVVEKELVFDIDITDYDNVRTCCSDANICTKCWKYVVLGCKVLNACLKEDFGYNNFLWVFSGRRGIHCWVCDKAARTLNQNSRKSIIKYIQSMKMNVIDANFFLSGKLVPHCIKRAVRIIEPAFVSLCIVEQNLLGTQNGINNFLNMFHNKEIQNDVKNLFNNYTTSIDRWNAFIMYHKNKVKSNKQYQQNWHNFIDEVKLQYCFPRLDKGVTEDDKHLLKSPFSVHTITGQIAVPFNFDKIESFDPKAVCTIDQLLLEIDKIKRNTTSEQRIKHYSSDYQATSLCKSINSLQKLINDIKQDK